VVWIYLRNHLGSASDVTLSAAQKELMAFDYPGPLTPGRLPRAVSYRTLTA
jgi:hypothetical protein